MDLGYAKMWFANYLTIVEIMNLHKQGLPHFKVVYKGIVSGTSSKLDI